MSRERIDLSDVTFVVPFSLDLPERLRNLRIVAEFLTRSFRTTVLVAEYDSEPRLSLDGFPAEVRRGLRHRFYRREEPCFQRTRSVNLAAREVETPFLAVHDSDVLLQTWQYREGVRLLREGRCDMCLPFANRVMWIPRDEVPPLAPRLDDEVLETLAYEVSDDTHVFLGLVNLLNARSFAAAGMMNENFRSWGYEEMELYTRLLKLGYRVLRTGGRAYHLGHGNGGDTGPAHPFFLENRREYHRVMCMNPDELRAYVGSWPWVSRVGAADGEIAA